MTSTNGEWQTAQPAVFDDGVTSEYPFANFFSVSCASPENCTAVGYFRDSSGYIEAFTMTLTEGVWQTAQPAVFDDGVTSEYPASGFESVSCASPGNCTAVGFFENSDDFRRAFTMTSTDGEWELAQPAQFAEGVQGNVSGQGFGTYLRSVSCASPGNCTAVGSFTNRDEINEPFTMTSTNGEWETPQPAQFAEGVQFDAASFRSVSCASPGNCTAVGSFERISDDNSSTDAFTMTSTREMPERARPAQFADGIQFDYARFNSVSCATPGNCTAVGFFEFPVDGQDDPAREAFTMTSTEGVWELARPAVFEDDIQNELTYAGFNSVSCATPGNCTAVGYFRNSSGDKEAFTMTMTDGEWETPQPAVFEDDIQDETPDTSLKSVSCASPGNCTAVGEFSADGDDTMAFIMTMTDGEWETAQPAVFEDDIQNELTWAWFDSVSCASPGNCTAVGGFERNIDDTYTTEAFTMTTGDDTYSSQSDSESSPTTTAPSPTTPAPTPTPTPTPTTTTPTTTTPPIPSPTTTQPKRVTKRNTQKVAPVVPAKSTSTTTAILEDVAQTTLAPEPQSPINTQPGHGSLGWWILGGSSIIGGSFIISAWWITHSLRRFQITKPSAVTVNS